ncbi:MAG: hypothetical protein OEX21_01320 [Betaproteobacteria bacterium]|nr:hypothetical protein [Betaproteobacteria bacterium]
MAILMWLTQDSQVFLRQPSRGIASPPPGWTLEKVAIAAADGTPLAGVLVLPPREPRAAPLATVIHFGGNAEEATAYAREADRNYGRRAVLLVNYRGYGDSGGRPGEKALVADALVLHDWVARRGDLDPGRICAHGRSLGAGVAVQLAAARPLKCLVLTSPFESLVAVGKGHMPWLPVGLLLRHRFECLQLAPALKVPALMVYGGADDIIPAVHSERLADAWGGPVERLRLEGFGHNDLDLDPRYAQAVVAFLDRHL